jgi:hypothetical protein
MEIIADEVFLNRDTLLFNEEIPSIVWFSETHCVFISESPKGVTMWKLTTLMSHLNPEQEERILGYSGVPGPVTPKDVFVEGSLLSMIGSNYTLLEILPPIGMYTRFLQAICERLSIHIDKARNEYGHYTIRQWDKLLHEK